MASTKYTYSISEDTANAKVDTTTLASEIQNAAITIALDYINTSGDDLDIWFKAEISSGEEDTLDSLVAAHDGEPIQEPEVPTDLDGRQIHHVTPRRLGTFTYFTGSSDNSSDKKKVGYELLTDTIPDTDILFFDMSGKSSDYKYMKFNCNLNESWICEGYALYKDCLGDMIEFSVVPKITENTSAGENTYFNLYGGYLIVPAAGDGLLNVSTEDMELVECVANEFGDYPAGFWDCDVNSSTGEFDLNTLTPNPYGTGKYNMFTQELTLSKFGNVIPLVGSASVNTHTWDSSQMGEGMRVRVAAKTRGDNHNWMFSVIMTMHRTRVS